MKRQAAAPVVSVADDGTVRVDGHLLEVTPEGLPGPGLELLAGGPPVEVTPPFKYGVRMWYCPRSGAVFSIARYISPGKKFYNGRLELGIDLESNMNLGRRDFSGTLEFRGQRWWLGLPGPLGRPTHRYFRAGVRPGDDTSDPGKWSLRDGRVQMWFDRHRPLGWMRSDLFSSYELRGVLVVMRIIEGSAEALQNENW